MTDEIEPEPISAMSFGTPEVHEGELCVPVVIESYPKGKITAYLPRAKLAFLIEKAEEGIEMIEEVIDNG